ncbi:TetR/AcrR family transcriptional regulator [Streptomyces sp. NPDC052396]|uniref:TetR/AcrR family transcriptional regulator n=1 Tax=Streptomyces sp. NPDC052396 TaxID=3365689 RepID=UPI0037D58C2A
MGSSAPRRRSDTRERIQEVALRLFLDQGYEKTALREIADELGVTKAALYYHFKTKEDILAGLFEAVGAELDEVIGWGREQGDELAARQELLERCSAIFAKSAPLLIILQTNQATLHCMSVGQDFKARVGALAGLLHQPDAPVAMQVRCLTALLTLHFGVFALQNIEGDPEEKRLALLASAQELLASAYRESTVG